MEGERRTRLSIENLLSSCLYLEGSWQKPKAVAIIHQKMVRWEGLMEVKKPKNASPSLLL